MNNIQINGQRRWGPPEKWSGPPPAHGTEIFIKNLPKEVFEFELYEIFSAMGSIYEVRLPVNWNGLNRGYAFLRFTSISAADRAIEAFDNYEIRNNRKIKVTRSVDNTRLFLSAVPIDKDAEDLRNDLLNYVENVKKVYVYPTLENRSVFRGYAFVEFETHRDAAIAKRVLTPDVCQGIFETKCVAAWANPLPFLDHSVLKSLNVLFIRNIPTDISSSHLKLIVENLTKQEIHKIKKLNDFAFLTFKDHKSAKTALNHLKNDPIVILDQETEAEWAVPREMVVSCPGKKFEELDNHYMRSESNNCQSPLEFNDAIPDNGYDIESRSGFPNNSSTLQECQNEIFHSDRVGNCFVSKDEETVFGANHLKNMKVYTRNKDASDPCYNQERNYESGGSCLNDPLSPAVHKNNDLFHSFCPDVCHSGNILLPKSSVEHYSLSAPINSTLQKSQGISYKPMELPGKFTDKANMRFLDIKNCENVRYRLQQIYNSGSDSDDSMANLIRPGVSPGSVSATTNWSSGTPSQTFSYDDQDLHPQSPIRECFFGRGLDLAQEINIL